jgi:uncharacterized protein DUF5675
VAGDNAAARVSVRSFGIILRSWPESDSVVGELLLAGVHECFTLEPKNPIPAGTYDLTIRFSPRFQRLMPHVENVPGHSGILWHWGNFPRDTEDCTLVGEVRENNFVGHSVAEFDVLFQKLQDALALEPQTVTYVDASPTGEITQ